MNPQPIPEAETRSPWTAALRALLGPLVGIAALAISGRFAGAHWPAIEALVASLGFGGCILYVVAWVALASACFPVSVLGVSAGVLFGLPLGVGLVLVAAFLAALVMFALGRGLLRGRIRGLIATRPKLAAIDRLAGQKALRLNALTRLSPLNYGLACYTLAAGRTSLTAYLVGNLATVPSLVLQVWVGTLTVQAGRSLGDDGWQGRHLALLGAGVLFLAILGWQIARTIRQALEQEDSG